MEANPDRLDNFEGEQNIRGASDRNEEYMTINSGEKGMYAGSINNAKRKEMARMMHDAEDLQTFEEDEKYADYIRREREKIGTVYNYAQLVYKCNDTAHLNYPENIFSALFIRTKNFKISHNSSIPISTYECNIFYSDFNVCKYRAGGYIHDNETLELHTMISSIV